MSATVAGLGLALLASLALNGAFVVQHAGARTAPEVQLRRPLRALRGLLSSPVWAAGTALGLAGWALHVGALARAPLSVVQMIVAGGLALVVPAARFGLHERPARGEVASVALVVAGLAVLAAGAQGAARGPVLGAVASPLALAALALAALPLARDGRAPLLGAAAGVLYGVADAAMKASTAVSAQGLGALAASPWPYLVILATAGAFVCFQRGLQTGAAVPVIATMTAATSLVAVLAGIVLFADPLGAGPAAVAAHLVAIVAVAAGVWRLAPAQASLAARAAG